MVDHIYDRRRVLPGRVARYAVTYADGTAHDIRVNYRYQITHWNSKLGAGDCDLAWQGTRPDGALLTLCAYEWRNPHPGKPVAAIDLVRTGSKVDVIVLAVTARR